METVTLTALATVSPRELAEILSGPPDRAAAWVAAAAENGIVEAQAVYGQYLLDGHGVPRDPAAALAWFRHAARADHPMAMTRLDHAALYLKGFRWVVQNLSKSNPKFSTKIGS